MPETSAVRTTQFDAIRCVVEKEGLVGEELTAREIHELVENHIEVSSPHEVATVLGMHSEDPGMRVVQGSPYRYVFR